MSVMNNEVLIESPKAQERKEAPAIRAIVDASWAAKFWFICFLVAVAGGFIAVIATVAAMKQSQHVTFVGRDGSIIYTPLQDFGTTEQFQYFAKQALRARFEMNPAGLSNPELLRRLFNPGPRQMAETEGSKLMDQIAGRRVQNYSQYVNVLGYTSPLKKGKGDQTIYSMRVTAQLDRSGVIDGVPFNENPMVVYDIEFLPNPDIANNGYFPLVVTKFEKVQETEAQ